ncbi:MAG: hypothetical protein LBT23_00380, partial [Synergistaceae bacterium]|nr:hypothetical protein [Synergistaceae bacterium]
GGLAPLFSDGVSLSSNYKPDSDGKYSMDTGVIPSGFVLDTTHPFAFEFEYEGTKYWIDSGDLTIASPPTLENIALALENKLQTIDPNITVTWDKKLDEDGNEIQWLHAETTSGPFSLSGFGGAADVIGAFTFGSEEIYENFDHTHIGFAAMMQMETALSSTEISVVPPQVWDTTAPGNAVHLNFASGTHHAEVFIADEANLTLDQLAARINSVCGDWLEAVVETDYPDGVNPIIDPLNNSGDNKENATQRLVLRTKTGEPLAVYDGLGKTGAPAGAYAETLGINTALGIQNIDLWQQPGDMPLLPPTDPDYVGYPTDGDGFFDENMPAILNVTVGDRTYQVKVCKNNRYNGKLVAEAIRDQVNEQYGGTLIALGKNVSPSGDPKDDVYSVYAVTGEPLRVVDAPYGDPRFTEFTGGIASQLGIASGLASMTAMSDTDTFGPGVIRISTPGHSIDVPVLAGETLHDIANRIRDYAGGWLDVSFFDSNMNASGGKVALTLAAKDGSAVSVFDAKGDVAWNMGMDTGLVGTADLATFPALSADSTITISVNGASHTIDLWDSDFVNSNGTTGKAVVSSVEELADLINTRFQGQDIRAEVISETLSNGSVLKRLALWSPKGYNFEITGTPAGSIPDDFGFTPGINAASNVHGNAGTPFNQVVTHRTGNNQYNVDFFGVMDNLVNTVEGGDVDGISDTMLSQLDSWLSTLLQCRSKAGALTNRYDTAVYRMQSNNTNYTDLYTQTVGIDLAEAFTEYETASAVYEASLAAIAKLLQPTLLDFLR